MIAFDLNQVWSVAMMRQMHLCADTQGDSNNGADLAVDCICGTLLGVWRFCIDGHSPCAGNGRHGLPFRERESCVYGDGLQIMEADVGTSSADSIGNKINTELREFAILAIYLYICFTALAYLKASILHDQGVDFAPWAFAAIKALVSAKFMLVGRALHVGEGLKKYPLIVPTLYKSVAFLVLVSVLTIIEEVSIAYLHGRSIANAFAEIGGGTRDQRVATSIILLLIFIPYFAFRSLGDIIGDKILMRLYFEPRRRTDI